MQFYQSLQRTDKSFLKQCPVKSRSTLMNEFEFDRLLEMVSEAVGSGPQENEMCSAWYFGNAPRAANDNQTAWSFVPFPAGWCASC